jgi:hypothetical protein
MPTIAHASTLTRLTIATGSSAHHGVLAPSREEGVQNPCQPLRSGVILERTIHIRRKAMRLFNRKRKPQGSLCPRCSQIVSDADVLVCPMCGWDIRDAYQGAAGAPYGQGPATIAPTDSQSETTTDRPI